ncbi:hypothetical protein T07_4541 [Trichinella nelsoni]|uniref:Uncharacterized protein n=1 Tax=Trichinella nelsoni TaxID=6336 RepID=A0A0V0SBN0_9BILA|nr:hypothetical protein T07_4541 [Trichinella nelsoni]
MKFCKAVFVATLSWTSVGRLPNRLDVRSGVGEDAREWLLELPCICHGSADDPKENALGPFSTFVFDAHLCPLTSDLSQRAAGSKKSVWSNGPTGWDSHFLAAAQRFTQFLPFEKAMGPRHNGGWASDSEYLEGSKCKVPFPLKSSVSKLIEII